MLNIKRLRNEFDQVKKELLKRGKEYNLEKFTHLDIKKRELLQKVEDLKNKQNIVSKEIPILKKGGKDVTQIMSEMKDLSETIKDIDIKIRNLDEEITTLILSIPNTPHKDVPNGLDDTDNLEVKRWKEPTKFDFEPKPHWDLGEERGFFDWNRANKIVGSRFTVYKGAAARLERALINFMLDVHTTENGYTEVIPPQIVNRDSLTGTGQLPKFEEDVFKIENTDYFLIPTAEVPLTNLHKNEILNGNDLTINYCGFTACFRSEAGSAGRDTRGLIRQHQFNKVELVKFTRPEKSYEELEILTRQAEKILELLGLPYRTVRLCGGDLGFCSAMTYDIEVWLPSYNRYFEISSCSNMEDYQARRANIRFKDNIKDKAEYVHTLNGSGLAVGRTVVAILENFQQKDGSVIIPEILVPYMNGMTKI